MTLKEAQEVLAAVAAAGFDRFSVGVFCFSPDRWAVTLKGLHVTLYDPEDWQRYLRRRGQARAGV